MIGRSRTGTGKTLAFGLPILELVAKNLDEEGTKNARGRYVGVCCVSVVCVSTMMTIRYAIPPSPPPSPQPYRPHIPAYQTKQLARRHHPGAHARAGQAVRRAGVCRWVCRGVHRWVCRGVCKSCVCVYVCSCVHLCLFCPLGPTPGSLTSLIPSFCSVCT